MSRHEYPYGYAAPASGPDDSATPQHVSARTALPTVGEMGGNAPAPWIRFPFFPTAPFYSTNPNVGYQVRYYSAGVLSTDADVPAVPAGAEVIRTIAFDIPCRIIAVNGSFSYTAQFVANNSFARGLTNPLDTFLFRMEYTTGDRLQTTARLASTVIGSGENPAEIGGTGYTVDQAGRWCLASAPWGISTMVSSLRGVLTSLCIASKCAEAATLSAVAAGGRRCPNSHTHSQENTTRAGPFGTRASQPATGTRGHPVSVLVRWERPCVVD